MMNIQRVYRVASLLTQTAILNRTIAILACALTLVPLGCEKCRRHVPLCSPGGFTIQMAPEEESLRAGVYDIEFIADIGKTVEVECTVPVRGSLRGDACRVLDSEGDWQIYAYITCSPDDCRNDDISIISVTIYRERETSTGNPIYEGPKHLEVLVHMEGMREELGEEIYDPKYRRENYGDDENCGWCEHVEPLLPRTTLTLHYGDS